MRRFTLSGLLAMLFLILGIAVGQTTSGDLVGTVVDASGAIVSGATVVVTNVGTGVSTTTKAGADGGIRGADLIPGRSNVTATADVFSAYTIKNLRISLNKTSTVNLTLSVPSSATTLDVSAEAAVTLDTVSTNLTQNFETRELAELER